MNFSETSLKGVFLVTLKKIEDDRGYFARGWCRNELADHGIGADFIQLNTAFSHRKGTIRGMHYQEAPHQEAKFVRCTRGAIFDVALDLRPESPTYGQWFGQELSAENGAMLYLPEGCAHGYQTLAPDTEMYYLTNALYAPAAAKGVRYDDPAFGIAWPLPVSIVSDADRKWPSFQRSHVNP